ncbi:13197_t:CDS:2, partial [Cetraspora pellucida]
KLENWKECSSLEVEIKPCVESGLVDDEYDSDGHLKIKKDLQEENDIINLGENTKNKKEVFTRDYKTSERKKALVMKNARNELMPEVSK